MPTAQPEEVNATSHTTTANPVTEDGAGDDATHVTEQAAPHVTQHVTSHDTEHTAEQATKAVDEAFTSRVRGRWTEEQRQFLTRFAKERRTTAGALLRHITAWYLSHEAQIPRSAMATDLLLPQERGMQLLDFLATPTMAGDIKRAAGHSGEAAYLRRAVDAYREHGTLIGRTESK